jgi:hypothetical protein
VLIGRDDGVVNRVISLGALAGGGVEVPGNDAVLEEPLIVEQGIREGVGLTGGEIQRLRGGQQLFCVGAQLGARADASHDRRDS